MNIKRITKFSKNTLRDLNLLLLQLSSRGYQMDSNKFKKVLENRNFGQEISNKAFADAGKYDWKQRAENIISFYKTET